MKPIKKNAFYTYWSCGLDTSGHLHKTKHTAILCMKKQEKIIRNKINKPDIKGRNRDIIRSICAGATLSEAAREYKISVTTVRDISRRNIMDAMRHYRRSNVLSTASSLACFYHGNVFWLYDNKEWLQLILEAYWRTKLELLK